jgi:uncharacterized membrane protein YkoI
MMNWVQRGLFAVMVAVLLSAVVVSMTARADSRERARQLQAGGDILPLEQITSQVHAMDMGRILEVELESEEGRHVYELEVLDEDGVVRDLYFDAGTGERLKDDGEQRD